MKHIAPQVNTYCTFCRDSGVEKVKAVWRVSYDIYNRACDAHKEELAKVELANKDDGHRSEADYQTWMRL